MGLHRSLTERQFLEYGRDVVTALGAPPADDGLDRASGDAVKPCRTRTGRCTSEPEDPTAGLL
ncbi:MULTISPECIES: hypothetical protein [unclassified Streptomyces]|uniref:hypothetical protein n=1 Tax=unclassified Streptomyces TaxID=2593676 RepID=UPI002E2AC466|nr:hypothetical protein [Streptomyces sp. NBC_01429]